MIFDGSADSLALWNSELRIVDVNPAYTRLFGYSRDEVIGMSLPGQSRRARAGRPLIERIRARSPARKDRWRPTACAATAAASTSSCATCRSAMRGEPHVLAVGRDITERKRAEAALRDSEAQYRAIFNASADALVLRDADFRIVDVNATYERMSGMPHAEVLGEDRVIANPAEVAPTIRALHQRALAGETVELEAAVPAAATARATRSSCAACRSATAASRTCCTSAATSPNASAPSRRCATARSSTARSSTPRPTRCCCAMPSTAAVEVNPAYLGMSGYAPRRGAGRDARADADRRAAAATIPASSTIGRWPARRCASRCRPRARTARASTPRCAACRWPTAASRTCCTRRATSPSASAAEARAARQRGAVPRDLQRLGRRADPAGTAASRRSTSTRRTSACSAARATRSIGRGIDEPTLHDRIAPSRGANCVQRALAGEACSAERRLRSARTARASLVEVRCDPVHAPGRAACAGDRARHHRAPRRRGRARTRSRRSCARRRRWRPSASSPAASRTTSTTS